MKINYKLLLIVFSLFLTISFIYIFVSSYIVRFTEGNLPSNKQLLVNNIYLDIRDNTIWQKDKYDSYKNIFNNRIDSINWCEKLIIWKSDNKYYKYEINNGHVSIYESKSILLENIKNNCNNKVTGLPSLFLNN